MKAPRNSSTSKAKGAISTPVATVENSGSNTSGLGVNTVKDSVTPVVPTVSAEAIVEANVDKAVKPSTVKHDIVMPSNSVKGAVRRFGSDHVTLINKGNDVVIGSSNDVEKELAPELVNGANPELSKKILEENVVSPEVLAAVKAAHADGTKSVSVDEAVVPDKVQAAVDNLIDMPKIEPASTAIKDEPAVKVGESVTLISTGFDSIDSMLNEQEFNANEAKLANGAIGLFAGLKLTVSGLIGAGGLAVVGIMLVHMNPFTWVTGLMVIMCLPVIMLTYICLRSMWNSWVTLKAAGTAVA